MSTQEPTYGTTGERLKAFALNEDVRDRLTSLAARYWEVATYAFLIVSAGILRFWNLGARAYHHDESLHAFFSYGLSSGLRNFNIWFGDNPDTYRHVPFMHGPFQFIGNGIVMAIIGDGDYQGRVLAAVMGTAMVGMPFLFRKQLGTWGAIAAAAFIAISPTLMYYSRFTREDIYTAFWNFGLVIFVWRYIASQENKFLYLSAGFMAFSFLTKETAFMTVGSFIIFLDYMFAMHLADKIRAKREMSTAQYMATVAGLVPIAWIVAIAWPFIDELRQKYDLDEMPPSAVLVLVLGTLAIPQYAPFVQIVMGTTWQNRAGEFGNLHIHPDERQLAYTAVFFFIGASSAIGMLWRPKIWLFAAAAFWIPYILLSTTFFSNGAGFFSMIWGSADYWISQQEVARGNQPEYYYFVTIPVYEFLPLALSVAATLYYAIRGDRTRALIVAAGFVVVIASLLGPAGPAISKAPIFRVWVPFGIVLLGVMVLPMHHFNRFLIFWALVTSLALTVASEKMPWLNVHITLALAVLAGKFVGDVIGSTDLRADLPKLERFAPFAYAAVAAALSILVFVMVGPFSPASFGAWALALVAAVAVYWAFSGYSARTGLQVAMVGAIAAFAVFTLRASVLAAWGHPDSPYVNAAGPLATRDYGDVPTEILVYTQTSGDVPRVRDMIADYARETGRGLDLPIVVDSGDGFTWPWAWYLREYRDVTYATISDNYQPPKAGSVLLISKSNTQKLSLGGAYDPGITYNHRRWFPEEYRGIGDGKYTTQDFFSDLLSKDRLSYWLDFWVRRTLPASEPGTVQAVAYFPKGSGQFTNEPAGPTVRTENTQIIIGVTGSAKGELRTPSDVAVDAAGNIYIADTENNRLQKYDANGVFQAEIGGFSSPDLILNQPWSMAVGDDGSIFVADTWNHKIIKLGSDLKQVDEWGVGGESGVGGDPFKLFGPREIIVTAEGNVMIADTGNARIIEYTPDGEFVRQFGAKGKSGGPLEFDEPVGLATNAAGDIYVADYWNRRIVILDRDLNRKSQIEVSTWGSQGVTDRPYIALLDDGRLLATDPANGTVLRFAPDGASLGAYEVPKEGRSTFARPVGIEVAGANVIIVDSGGNVARKIPLAEVIP